MSLRASVLPPIVISINNNTNNNDDDDNLKTFTKDHNQHTRLKSLPG